MTREEFDEILEQTNAVICNREWYERAIKALEQERSRSAEITQYRYDCEKLMEENERLKKALEQEPCEDCISRKVVLDLVEDMTDQFGVGHRVITEGVISMLPPVTPKPKTGHWIAQDIHNCHTDFRCSECGYIHSFMHLYGKPTADYTYCPNCGAKME